jgi:hypothetical protein
MKKNGIVSGIVGFAIGLAGIYIVLRVASAGWKSGQK